VSESGDSLFPGVVVQKVTMLNNLAVSKSLYSLTCVIEESSLSEGAGFLDFVVQCGAKGWLGWHCFIQFLLLKECERQ